MRYISICSGIEAASVAWAGLGWQCAAVAEIDPFASAVLAHRFPDDWTLVPYRGKPACDGPRYRAIGNSMAVPVMRWIGEQIHEVKNANT